MRFRELLGAAGAALSPGLQLSPPDGGEVAFRGRRPRVLFLCTGNSARSQMAEALLEDRSGGLIEARSAGSHPKTLHPNVVAVMAERGTDIASRATKPLNRFARSRFGRIITLCDKVREICPEFPGQPSAVHWSMPDPAAAAGTDQASYAAFVQTADELETRIRLLIAQMTAESGERKAS